MYKTKTNNCYSICTFIFLYALNKLFTTPPPPPPKKQTKKTHNHKYKDQYPTLTVLTQTNKQQQQQKKKKKKEEANLVYLFNKYFTSGDKEGPRRSGLTAILSKLSLRLKNNTKPWSSVQSVSHDKCHHLGHLSSSRHRFCHTQLCVPSPTQ